MRKNFAPYLSYKRDNNELLLFALKALSRDTAAYMRNRYGTEQEVIEIAEGDLLDKVRAFEILLQVIVISVCDTLKNFQT